MKKVILSGLFLFSFLTLHAQYHGRVFVDSNQNDQFDAGEKLLKGVVVSDGLNVTKTAGNGTFQLTGHQKAKFIFITTPSGYKTNNAYYRPLSPETKSYDFGVIPYDGGIQRNGAHRFIHISDTEIGEVNGHEDWTADLRRYASNEKAAFIIHTGDICYIPGLKSHIKLMNTANMNTPVFYCIGNHDLVQGKYGEEVFEQLYGPVFYSFNAGNTHYIVTPMPGGDHRPSYQMSEVLQWLKNDLAQVDPSKSVVVFNHDLLDQTGNFCFTLKENEVIDLKAHNLKAWLYGHWHINHMIQYPQSGIYSICTSTLVRGGIDHASSGFRIMKVNEKGDLSSELRYSYINRLIEIASIDNNQSPVLKDGAIPLSVNVYSTSAPTKKVSCSYSCEGKSGGAAVQLNKQTDFNWYTEIALPRQWDKKLVTVCATALLSNGEKIKSEKTFFYHRTPNVAINPRQNSLNLLGNPAHAGTQNDTLALPIQLEWVKNIGSNGYMCSPLFYNKGVYVASVDENCTGKAAVVCMDGVNGKIRWNYKVRGSIKNSMAITAGILFAQDSYGYLYALNATTGALAWEKKLNLSAIPALNEGLVADHGVVYAGTGLGLCALKADNGETMWTNKEWQRREGCTTTLSLNKNVLIGHAHWQALYANDATTGQLLWQHAENGLRHRASPGAMVGQVLYMLSDESLFIIETQTGNVLIRKPLGYNVNVSSVPLVTDKEIIFGTAARGVVALDKETLAEKWAFQTGPALIYSAPYVRNPSATVETSPVLSGDKVFFAASDGVIYGLNKSTGKLLWKHTTGAPFFSTVLISGQALYAADFSGNVYGFKTGK